MKTESPPPHLDGALVLRYAISQHGAFYHLGGEAHVAVPAMAICRYDGAREVYLFKCDTDWEVIMDTDCDSVDEAMQTAARQAKSETPVWITVSSD
jgi:hypothetical protein